MSAENVEYLSGVYERWGRGDFTPDPSFPDDMTIELGPEFPDAGRYVGPEGIAGYMRAFLEPWDLLTIRAEKMTDAGGKVLVSVLQSGTGKSSGVPVELRYFHLWTFDGARPVRMENIMEESDAQARLGEASSQGA